MIIVLQIHPIYREVKLSKQDILWCKRCAADEEGLSLSEVKKAVIAYFDSIVSSARKLPFDKDNRIYSRKAFAEYPYCINLPYLGRLGPFYSLYLKWRAKEAKEQDTVPRSQAKKIHRKPLIEEAAKQALSGNKVDSGFLRQRLPSGKYKTVWLVDEDNKKKAAKQMIINK